MLGEDKNSPSGGEEWKEQACSVDIYNTIVDELIPFLRILTRRVVKLGVPNQYRLGGKYSNSRDTGTRNIPEDGPRYVAIFSRWEVYTDQAGTVCKYIYGDH